MDILRVDAAKVRRLWEIMENGSPPAVVARGHADDELAQEARAIVSEMLGIDSEDEAAGDLEEVAEQQKAVGDEGYQ